MPQHRSANPGQVRVLLVEDHALVRKALRLLLERSANLVVVGECQDGKDAIRVAMSTRPDIVLMDANLPTLNGFEATRRIRRVVPEAKVIIVSAYGDRARLKEALAAGAHGYLLKRSDLDELALAFKAVQSGNQYVSADLASAVDLAEVMYEAKRAARAPGVDALSPREREVLQLVAEGQTAKVIARELGVTEKTVEAHKTNLMQKLGFKNRTEVIRYALRCGIIEPDPGAETGVVEVELEIR